MTKIFDRDVYFAAVRDTVFGSAMNQDQIDGQNYILDVFEEKFPTADKRWLGYALATTRHETAATMQPIEEYGKGAGMSYGVVDSETGWAYYGRGFVQLTWDYNYQNATERLKLVGDNDLYWHADRALDPKIAAAVMFMGMAQGWFRTPHKFDVYFNDEIDDPVGAREIINGDKNLVPDWDAGTIGEIIKGYYMDFTAALNAAARGGVEPTPRPPQPQPPSLVVRVIAPPGVTIIVEGETS